MNRIFLYLVFILFACSPQLQLVDTRPDWLTGKLNEPRYYIGVGHSAKDGSNNYIQSAKKSALDDLVSQIKVTVSSTSILNVFEQDRKEFRERYEQIIQTDVADEIEEFEQVGAYEDDRNYWVYYRLSKERYRQIKEQQKRNAVTLATDFLHKARKAEQEGARLQAIGFYFQAFRSVEKYLAEAIPVKIDDREVLLTNEIYASVKALLDKIQLQVEPAEMTINRRLNLNAQPVMVKAMFTDTRQPASNFPLSAAFEKGGGEVFPNYITDENGSAKILISKIASRDFEQTVVVKLNLDAISGTSESPVYELIASTLTAPSAKAILKVQRPVVYLTSTEKSLGILKNSNQISNRLKNLLTNAGFEFSTDSKTADLLLEVLSDSEKGSISGSIYITFLTGVIRVAEAKGGRVIYATTLDRIKGYGLDYDRSSQDAYSKAMETLEKERMTELLNNVLQ
ncbi:MAG: LPP20 family lipoprotein [Cyclobacteriaceae bacterium]|nr:LPP20 family lipoprotein [Cyclobacteriaceae bacterium]